MKQIVVAHAGAPLQLVEALLNAPEPNEVQIRIIAAGVSFADILMRHGLYPAQRPFPLVPGYEIAGIVEQSGAQVESVYHGQLVAALTVVGGYADRINLPASEVVWVPPAVTAHEAAGVVLNYLTAYQILHRTLQVKGGERVLIHSAAGGVGTALLQLGQQAGLEMYGTASRGKHDLIEAMGAVPIDYQNEDFVERVHRLTQTGVDIVLDPLGGDHLHESYRALNEQGRLVAFGTLTSFQNGKPQRQVLESYKASIEQFNRRQDGRQALAYSLYTNKTNHPDWIQADLKLLFDLLVANNIRPVIKQCLTLQEAPLAHELLETGKVAGKIVLTCDQAQL